MCKAMRALTIGNMNWLLLVLVFISLREATAQQQVRATQAVCGDGVCQDEENCDSCPIDCCAPTDDDYIVPLEEARNLELPRILKLCSSGPNQALPCESDSDCGKVCSQSPTQLCNADAACAGDENICSEISGSCNTYELRTDPPSPMPSVSEMPSQEPSTGSEPPSMVPSSSPVPSFMPSTSQQPSSSLLPTIVPSFVPSSEPSISSQPSSPVSPLPSLVPTTSGMPSLFPSGGPSSQPTLTFFAMGDVPFSKQESCLIPYELNKLSSSGLGSQFLIHLGDIRDSFVDETLPCPEFVFSNLTSTFSSSPVQTFFLPGERGWLDCPNPGEAYDYWKDHLLSFTSSKWPEFPSEVTRHPNRTELFSFVTDEVLFLGQSLPGPARNSTYESSIRDELLLDNIIWTEQALVDHIGEYMAVVVFGNDFQSSVNAGYLKRLLSLVATDYEEFPTLLLQNGASFNIDTPIDTTATNVMFARTDDTVTPLAITVDPWAGELNNVFKFDRRCYCTFGHRPTRFKMYLPWGECAGVCDEAQEQCENVEGCSPPGNTC